MNTTLFQFENVKYKNLIYSNIVIPSKKINFITGESGAGKSTLLKLLNKTISQDSGNIFYSNKNLQSYEPVELRKNVSLVSQEIFLFQGTIFENFIEFYNLRNLKCPSYEDISNLLHFCCLDIDINKNVSNLSGGEKQRVYIALFLSFKPKVLMLDEPTSALDETTSHKLLQNIIEFCKSNNTELIIISHNQSLVSTFSENEIKIAKEITN